MRVQASFQFCKAILAALLGVVFFGLPNAQADYEHERIRRVVVFPMQVESAYAKEAEEAWWEIRERLTESKRFVVASRNFMQAKEVFQARGELKPADAIILGRILDANALYISYLKERVLSVRVYETKNGLTLWQMDYELHPTVPVSKQLKESALRMLTDFVGGIPYQGHVIVDSLVGKPTFFEGEKMFFKADVGLNTQVTVGDNVQVVALRPVSMNPVFLSGSAVEVYSEGVITQVDRQIVTVQVTRRQAGTDIKAEALIRIPDELRRMKEAYGMTEDPMKNVAIEMYKGKDDELTDKQKERQPLITSLAWIGNLALLLALAF